MVRSPEEKRMSKERLLFLEFVRHVVNGKVDEVSRQLAASPALATKSAEVGAAPHGAPDFFFPEIAHYIYRGDTALHLAAAAFRRPIAMLLIAHGADCHAK
ncbi:MAG TPA: ankyrin repeat domain-containing protein, partial [Bacteroidota bacterium]|nr:ankyrin repeat domain-containing protein [Bacteroidota bacterium]